MTALDVLREARHVVENGGDSTSCKIGPFCLRCCLALAKTALDRRAGKEPGWPVDFWLTMGDLPLLSARDAVAKYDGGVAHDQASALALLGRVINEEAT